MRAPFGSWEVHQNTKNVTPADIARAVAPGGYTCMGDSPTETPNSDQLCFSLAACDAVYIYTPDCKSQKSHRTQESHTEMRDREGCREVKPGSKPAQCRVQVVGQRLMKLDTKSAVAGASAEVIIRRLKKSRSTSGQVHESWEMVRARGHLTEVQNLRGAHRASLAPCGPS